ncbi:CoA transferase [Variovorax sp. J31P207]|uniref:CaiB/BaiF CoA transferase family protein n=1 Tax=Variovorax sp. J31P207 TaxID=3053510 RepID=UPI00257913CA|nr:CoA transferase [Variovorax sp. J31P207]MDM0069963.1 CoA transferase [Variovorax sp. J31P207]
MSTCANDGESRLLALEGVRVIEIGTFISGPFAATLLADFGANVIKLELPEGGDPMRTLGAYPAGGDSSYWWSAMGRNKRSVALDVRTSEGRQILGRLLEKADVLVENFRPGTLDRWGITLEWMKERRPDLIVARISGYGQDGPWRDMPGFDRNAQAFAGLVHVTGEPDMPPQQCGLPVCDFTAGLWAAFGIVVALLGRNGHGASNGNEIDLALYESIIPFLKDMPQRWRHQGRVTERTGNMPDYVAPGGAYRTGSGDWIFISGTGDRVFERLLTAVGRPDVATADAFRHNRDRVAHRPVLDAAINEWLSIRTTDEAIAALQAADVPAVKINSIADLMAHPQVAARGNFVEVPDHDRGDLCMPAPVPRMTQFGPTVRWAGERLGESTREVLQEELSLDECQLAELRSRGVILY